MIKEQRISPFQVTALLLCGNLFFICFYSLGVDEMGSRLAGLAIGFLLQLGVAFAMQRLGEWLEAVGGSAWPRAAVLVILWLGCFAGAVFSAAAAARMLSDCFYGGSRLLLTLLLLMAAGAFAAYQGLQPLARSAPFFALLGLGALAFLLIGAVRGLRTAYLPSPELSIEKTAAQAAYSLFGNLGLLMLPLLRLYCTKPLKKRAVAVWLLIIAVITALLSLASSAAMGYYLHGKSYPVRQLARVDSLISGQTDILLIWLWTLLAFVQISLLLWLCCAVAQRLKSNKARRARLPLLHGTAALLAAMLLLSGCSGDSGVAGKTLVTMLELVPGDDPVTLRLEYLDLSSGEEQKQYLVCEGGGETVQKVLEGLENDYGRRFYLNGVSLLVLTEQGDRQASVLEQLETLGQLRPLTPVLVAREPVLEAEAPQEGEPRKVSAATALRGLFAHKGGRLNEKGYTLMDCIAQLRDPSLTLLLPLTESREEQPVIIGRFEVG